MCNIFARTKLIVQHKVLRWLRETFNVERIFEHASFCSGSFGDRCNRVRQQRTERAMTKVDTDDQQPHQVAELASDGASCSR